MNNEELNDWINEEIKKIEEDERFNYPPASIRENIGLAMVQLSFDTRLRTLKQFKEKLTQGES